MTPAWTTACPDWAERIRTGKSIIPPPIFPEEAEAALKVFKEFRIVDAPGSPKIGDACAPWVFELAAALFGSYDAESGRSLIKEVMVLVSKKNSKSTIAGAIMLTALVRSWRQSAQFVVIAPTTEVATNAFAPARDMVARDEELDALINVQTHIKTLTNRTTNATLKVLAADSNTVGGLKAVGVLVDELHLFGKISSAESMFREAFGGLASRPEGFIVYLTTQSDEPPSGIFKQKLDYARAVRDGKVVDNGFLPILFEHPDDMVANGDCLKLEHMWMTNPNIGYSVDNEFLEREYKKAELAGGDSFRGFMSKHANVELGLNLRSDRWAGADFWEQQGRPGLTLEDVLERSEVIDVGIDGGGLDDLLGLAVLGRDIETHEWLLWAHAWAHPSVLERRKSEASRFRDFAKDGDLTLVTEMGEDAYQVAEIVARCEESGLLDKVGCDPAGLGGILAALVEAEVPQEKVVGISQGWKMTGAIKTAERKLAEGGMVHGGRPMMSWCVGNAKIEPRGNAIVITKQASGTAKIDPLLAAFNAVTLMSLNPEGRGSMDAWLSSPVKGTA